MLSYFKKLSLEDKRIPVPVRATVKTVTAIIIYVQIKYLYVLENLFMN